MTENTIKPVEHIYDSPKKSKWLFYKIYVDPEHWETNMYNVDFVLKQFYDYFYDYIYRMLLWHYFEYYHVDKHSNNGLKETGWVFSNIDFENGDKAAYIRFRFRVDEKHVDKIKEVFDKKFLEPNDFVIGWRYYDNYDPKRDLGYRFGNIDEGVDPTEPLTGIFTYMTELMFYYRYETDKEIEMNHDVLHLYFNTLGYGLEGEIKEMLHQIHKTITWVSKDPEIISNAYDNLIKGVLHYKEDHVKRLQEEQENESKNHT